MARFDSRREMWQAAKQKTRTTLSLEAFNAVCDELWSGETGLDEGPYGDAELREVLQALKDKSPKGDPRPDNGDSTLDALEAQAQVYAGSDEDLKMFVTTVRQELFGTSDPPFRQDLAASSRWIHEQDAKQGSTIRTVKVRKGLHYISEDGTAYAVAVAASSPLDRLRGCAEFVSSLFNVEVSQAVAFILNGYLPVRDPITVEIIEGWPAGRGRIIITVHHPDVEPDDVRRAYAKARNQLWKTERAGLKARDVELVRFIKLGEAGHETQSSAQLARWNEQHRDMQFDSIDTMRKAYQRALKRVFPESRFFDSATTT